MFFSYKAKYALLRIAVAPYYWVCDFIRFKRGSRGAARAAKSLRWSV